MDYAIKAFQGASIDGAIIRIPAVDGWRGVAAAASMDRECAVLCYPVETASLSEARAEKIHQGVCLRILYPVSLPPGGSGRFSLAWAFKSVA